MLCWDNEYSGENNKKIIALIDSNDTAKYRSYIKKKYNISIGKYRYGYDISSIGLGSIIGNFCSIASGVKIGLMNHPIHFLSTNPFLYYSSRGFIEKSLIIDTKIGAIVEDDVWIGSNAIILPGVTIGKGAIIGAGAVVTKSVPPYAIVCGVPAKIINYRFEEKIRLKLAEINWTQWDDNRIKKSISLMYDVEKFIEAYENGLI